MRPQGRDDPQQKSKLNPGPAERGTCVELESLGTAGRAAPEMSLSSQSQSPVDAVSIDGGAKKQRCTSSQEENDKVSEPHGGHFG